MFGQTCELTKEIKMSIIAHSIVMVNFMMINNNYKLITFINNPLYNLIIYDKIYLQIIIDGSRSVSHNLDFLLLHPSGLRLLGAQLRLILIKSPCNLFS